MNFDYTYISVFGFLFYEPMVLLTNSLFFLFSLFFFKRISTFKHSYAQQMAFFILFLGISSLFGAIGHTVHYQLGRPFFDLILLLMNVTSLVSVYFLFRASYTYLNGDKKVSLPFSLITLLWLVVVIVISFLRTDFTLIKVHAGLALLFTLVVHYRSYLLQKSKGNEWLIIGILISFLPIIIHTMHLSIHTWFNHKDLAHVFMIISLIVIYKGLRVNVIELSLKQA